MALPNMHDSGERESFTSGAVRDTANGKPRPDLISPHANLREGAWLAKGAEKYKERNWEAGINISRCIASLSRHLEAYKLGLIDEDHMAAIRTNAGFILHYEEEIKVGRMDPTIDDMPKYMGRDQVHLIPYMPYDEDEEILCGNCGVPILIPMDPYITIRCAVCGWTQPQKSKPEVHIQSEPPTFYVAGPMRGYKDLNFPAFDEAAERGRKIGYTIISPADLDREHGIDPAKNPSVTEHEDHLSPSDLHRIVRRDIEAIMSLQPERGDGVAVLGGWGGSTGAMAEVALARWLGLKVVYAVNFFTVVGDK